MAGKESVPNPLKELLKAGKVALGMNVRIVRSGDIARIAKTTGHDFIFIDNQHSLFTTESIGNLAQVALGCNVAPLVRVRSCDDPDVQPLLDNCVTGIIFPDISTADEAQRAVDRAKYPPYGKRSVGGGYPIFDYRPVSTADVVPALNDNTLVVCLLESKEGLENIEEIAAVEGVDVIHIGSNDLLADMGLPGAFGSPEHLAAVDRIMSVTLKHGKVPGIGGDRDLARQADFIRKGARFITTHSEIAFMIAEGTRVTRELRKAIA